MNIVVLGPQGSGKGTQAKLLSQKYSLVHISSGQLLRDEASSGSPKGKLIAKLQEEGTLVPFDTVLEVIEPVLTKSSGFILDGTPRDVRQAAHLDWFLKNLNQPIDFVILLDIPKEESIKRLLLRAQKENRSDDTPDSITRRLELYQQETVPVLDYYQEQGKLIKVDGTPDIDTIHQDILTKLSAASSSL